MGSVFSATDVFLAGLKGLPGRVARKSLGHSVGIHLAWLALVGPRNRQILKESRSSIVRYSPPFLIFLLIYCVTSTPVPFYSPDNQIVIFCLVKGSSKALS